jgi:hypothetical protein
MKTVALFASLALGLSADAQPSVSAPAQNHTLPKAHLSSPASTKTLATVPAASGTPMAPPPQVSAPPPAPAAPAKSGATLDAYVADLTDALTLSKDEQTDIKTYYQDDGAKLLAILNDPNLSPIQQQEHVDDMRNVRNAKIGALLQDVDRQGKFLEIESTYRVALIELAAQGQLVPTSTPPNVPEPTATTPAQAEKTPPGVVNADAAPR